MERSATAQRRQPTRTEHGSRVPLLERPRRRRSVTDPSSRPPAATSQRLTTKRPAWLVAQAGRNASLPCDGPSRAALRSVPAWIRCDADDRVRRARLERCARRRRAAQEPARALRRRPEVVVRQAPSGHHNPRRKVDIVIPKKKSRVPDRHSMRSYASNAAVRPHVRASNDSQHRDATPRAAEFILKCVSCQPPCAIRCRCPCPGNSGHCVRCPVVGRLLRT